MGLHFGSMSATSQILGKPMGSSQSRIEQASTMLMRAACQSAESGTTQAYFKRWGTGRNSEAKRRQQFHELRSQLKNSRAMALENAIMHFGKLNGDYGTRFDLDHLEVACKAIVDSIPDSAWHSGLFDLDHEQVVEHASLVSEVLRTIGATAKKRPYSLTTKYLHFLFPDLFVIYDSQAAKSIWMWGLFAYGDGQPEAGSLTVAKLSSTNASGYRDIMQCYHRIWHSCAPDERSRAVRAAKSLDAILVGEPDCQEARVSVLDLIDKHLWKCDGDPIRLGLASPP